MSHISIKMIFKVLFLLYLNVRSVVMLRHEKPVAEKVWSERCQRNTIALNDCNWCSCNVKSAYTCKARACGEVDMFGHFNDAIRDMDVGMNGHGVWRSDAAACEAGVHYRKNELLCVCTEDGKWPNAVCRDIFQILHPVESTDHKEPSKDTNCSATKLYLFDCNVCFCPSNGRIDPKYCTKRQCHQENVERSHNTEIVDEVYASCTPTKHYKLGCQTCVCLRNNRLVCDNCTNEEDHNLTIAQNTICYQKTPGVIFQKGCNLCHCNKKETIYCTAKKCLQYHTKISLPQIEYDLVEHIQDEYNCIPGSKYKKDCNTCHCFIHEGVKYFGCSMNSCKEPSNGNDTETCVEGTSYQANCLICHCVVEDGVKREFCHIDDSCKTEDITSPQLLASMHGYCEPLHFYQQDCNKCRCLADGKTVACTSKICSKKSTNEDGLTLSKSILLTSRTDNKSQDKSVIVEFIPFVQKDNFCPKGQTYKVDCNVCYCMRNGNAVCTTKQC
ncbi:uncharacterized protein LOC111350931 [Spodoptera litura]|uniref:Uncharacterized protein LOC111350931 n=1 Tax=Spodoptera litura TaxID=69820 RepID=A0A9J7DW54_SPOLT|nr:uncharacterized protein LOC111350931 [Spodoptera litura]